MYCESCGTQIQEGQKSCYKCGAPVLPELIQSSEKNRVLIDPTAADQNLPPFVRNPEAEPEAKPEPAPVHGADTQPFLTKSNPESQPAVDADEELKTSPSADYPNHYENTGPSEKVNAAANVGLFTGILFFVFNIVVLIFSLTGVGDKIFDISVFELYLLLPYWVISWVGVISCINNKASRPKAVLGIMLCITNTIIYAVIFKNILAPYYLDQILNAFSPPMPRGFSN